MTAIRATFDGKAFVPDEPVDIPVGTAANVVVQASATPAEKSEQAAANASVHIGEPPLMELVKLLEAMPQNSTLPPDYASELDHYLYGTPKRSKA